MTVSAAPCFRCQSTITPADQCTVSMPGGSQCVCADCMLVMFALHKSIAGKVSLVVRSDR